MESLEVSAKTVEEAIDLALKRLEVDRAEVDVVVVTEGRAGILGIGSEPARVKVTPKDKTPEAVNLAKEVLEDIFDRLDVDAEVRLRTNSLSGKDLSLDILGDDSGLLIGRGGVTSGLPPVHGELRRQPQTQRMVPRQHRRGGLPPAKVHVPGDPRRKARQEGSHHRQALHP